MLVLSRKVGEVINISDNISITVIEIEGKRVSLGIKAPREIRVHRGEVFLKIQEQKEGQDNG